MNWIIVKNKRIYMWMKILERFKNYIRKKTDGRKKEKEYRIKKYFYTNYIRNYYDLKLQSLYLYKIKSIIWKNT